MTSSGKLKLCLVLLAMLWLAMVALSWAGAGGVAEAAEIKDAPQVDDEYNFNWLDPEKKIYVLQNRRYLKAHRAVVTVMTGLGLNNPYRTVYNFDPRVAYYFTEAWGIEGFYTASFNSPNNTEAALGRATGTTLAVIREIHSQLGVQVHWVPWYAKINVFNRILYFDWYFAGGGGVVGWVPGTSPTASNPNGTVGDLQNRGSFFASTGHQFHLSELITVRLDLTGAYYNAPIVGITGDTSWYSNYNFGFGLGFRL